MMRSLSIAILALAIAFTPSVALAASGDPGGPGYWGNRDASGQSVIVNGEQSGSPSHGAGSAVDAAQGPPTRTIDCGAPSVGGSGEVNGSDSCGLAHNVCAPAQGAVVPPDVTTAVTQQWDGAVWQEINLQCAALRGTTGPPPVTADMVREQAVKLIPPVAFGMAPDDAPTLVDIQTIVWSPTPTAVDLDPVTILGQPVTIHLRFHHATYAYGDGTSSTSTTPGRPWTPGTCSTPQCPGYDGHTYRSPTRTTATATLTWTATFTVADGPDEPVPGTIDGPTTDHAVTVIAARSVLVR